MSVYALRLENGTDDVARVRMADLLGLSPGGNITARGGIRPGPTAGDVSIQSGTMNAIVQPFMGFVDGGVSDAQGGYPFVSNMVLSLTLANGHATLSRTDVIAAVVRDDVFDGGGSTSADVEVIQGTPGAGVPTLPDNALPLRNIVVPAGASVGSGGLTSGALSTDRRRWLTGLGGVLPVASQSERDALTAVYDGLVVYLQDSDVLQVRRGGAWVEAATGKIQSGVVPLTFGSYEASASVTFPVPFAAAPRVVATGSDAQFGVSVYNITATGFTIRAVYNVGTPPAGFGLTCQWIAHR